MVFWVQIRKVNIFVFSDKNSAANRKQCKSNIKVFLMIKSGPGFMGSLVYSLIRCNGHKSIQRRYNIDEN